MANNDQNMNENKKGKNPTADNGKKISRAINSNLAGDDGIVHNVNQGYKDEDLGNMFTSQQS